MSVTMKHEYVISVVLRCHEVSMSRLCLAPFHIVGSIPRRTVEGRSTAGSYV